MPSQCQHDDLLLTVSDFGVDNGFERASNEELAAAATPHNSTKKARSEGIVAGIPSIFPGPLVLPDDVLAVDPEENEPQSLHEYIHLEERNVVTSERKTIYIVAPPTVDRSVDFVADWTTPNDSFASGSTRMHKVAKMHESVMQYVSAFYHGMPVKMYRKPMKFVQHAAETGKSSTGGGNKTSSRGRSKSKAKNKTPDRIDMVFGDDLLLDIRTRPCRDGVFPRQLNLNDLIDVLINALPDDAYAMMMLVNHDIYEDEDDFCCGRAYGGSRVGVVSTARYNPSLDAKLGWDGEHAWPASHCRSYADQCTTEYEKLYGRPPAKKKAKKTTKPSKPTPSTPGPKKSQEPVEPLRAAITAYRQTWSRNNPYSSSSSSSSSSLADATGLWTARVCKTVTHELGHCIGIDHCTYYACMMQATCGMQEDARQPPYVCPVDEAKVCLTTGTSVRERKEVILRVLVGEDGGGGGLAGGSKGTGKGKESEGREGKGKGKEGSEWVREPMWAAYAAWLGAVLEGST